MAEIYAKSNLDLKDGAMVGKVVISGANIFRLGSSVCTFIFGMEVNARYLGGGGGSRA